MVASMLWVVFIQIALLLLLVSPGVLSIATGYAFVAELYIVFAITINNPSVIEHAAKINTSVAAGIVLLQFLIWQSCDNLRCNIASAYRASWFTVAGIVMVVTSEYLLRSIRKNKPATDAKQNESPDQDSDLVVPEATSVPILEGIPVPANHDSKASRQSMGLNLRLRHKGKLSVA